MKGSLAIIIISIILLIISVPLNIGSTILKYGEFEFGSSKSIGYLIGLYIIPAIVGIIVLAKTKKKDLSLLVFSVSSVGLILLTFVSSFKK